jgi:nucleoid DNA-binding protein
MTRRKIAKALYDSGLDLSSDECRYMVDATIDEIIVALVRGQKVGISGFGSFVLRRTGERMARNPKTGAPAKVPSRRSIVFRPSGKLRTRCAEGVSDTRPPRTPTEPLQRVSASEVSE